jgi:hypothetical protein
MVSQKSLTGQFDFPRSFACLESALRYTDSASLPEFDLLFNIWVWARAVVWEVYASESTGAEIVVALSYKQVSQVSYMVARVVTRQRMLQSIPFVETYLHSTSAGIDRCHLGHSATDAAGAVAARRLRTFARRS